MSATRLAFDELSDEAKQAARNWYRAGGLPSDWYEAVFEDFERVCKILGVELGRNAQGKAKIAFTGFWSQGDGASFEGTFSYAKRTLINTKHYAPKDKELQRIASALQAIQQANAYQLYGTIDHRGHYYHENSMVIWVDGAKPSCPEAEEVVIEALRDLARWLYKKLEAEFEFQNSDETIDELLMDNCFAFDSNGDPL